MCFAKSKASDRNVRPTRANLLTWGPSHRAATLRNFREDCKRRGLIETYSSLEEFRDKFTRQLTQTVLREFKETEPPDEAEIRQLAQQKAVPPLLIESRELLIECSQASSPRRRARGPGTACGGGALAREGIYFKLRPASLNELAKGLADANPLAALHHEF
jgi:hypothetical protein